MDAALTDFVNFIDKQHWVLNLDGFESPHNLAGNCTHVSSAEALECGSVPVTSQSYSVILSSNRSKSSVIIILALLSNGLADTGFADTWRAHEA